MMRVVTRVIVMRSRLSTDKGKKRDGCRRGERLQPWVKSWGSVTARQSGLGLRNDVLFFGFIFHLMRGYLTQTVKLE